MEKVILQRIDEQAKIDAQKRAEEYGLSADVQAQVNAMFDSLQKDLPSHKKPSRQVYQVTRPTLAAQQKASPEALAESTFDDLQP